MSEDEKWSQLPLTELRFLAKKYKQFHSLGNIGKAKKADLITTLNKFMMFDGDTVKQKPNATPIATTGTMEAPAPKAKKAKVPAPPPAPAVMGDKGYTKKVKKVKDPKKQMESASADAKAIVKDAQNLQFREVLTKDAMERVRQKQYMREKAKEEAKKAKAEEKKKAKETKAPPAPPPAPAVMGDKGYKKSVKKVKDPKKQMEGAVMDAKKIAEDAKAMGHSVAEHKKMMAKDDAKKAKASKPASMPMMTDSGASASSAPAKVKKTKPLTEAEKKLPMLLEQRKQELYSLKSFDEVKKYVRSDERIKLFREIKKGTDDIYKKYKLKKVKGEYELEKFDDEDDKLIKEEIRLENLEDELQKESIGSGDFGTFMNKTTRQLEFRQANQTPLKFKTALEIEKSR